MRKWLTHSVVLLLYLTLVLICCRNMVWEDGFPAGWDAFAQHYPTAYFATDAQFGVVWEDMSTGYPVPLGFFQIVLPAMNRVIGDAALTARVFFLLMCLMIPVSMYVFVFRVSRSRVAALVAGVVYLLNPWALSHLANGHYDYMLAYLLIPLGIMAVDGILKRSDRRSVVGLAVVFVLLLSLRVDPVAYVGPFLLLYCLWVVVFSHQDVQGHWWRRLLLSTVLAVLMSAFIWLPLILVGSPHASTTYSLSQVQGGSLPLLDSVSGFGLLYSYMFWDGGLSFATHPAGAGVMHVLIMLVPMIAFAPLLSRRASPLVKYLAVVALLAIFLAKGPYPPFGEAYEYLYRHVPLANRFHEPNRWLMLAWFAYAALVGVALHAMLRRTRAHRSLVAVTAVATSVALLGFLTPYPFTKGFLTWVPPEGEIAAYEAIPKGDQYGRVWTLPYEYAYMFTPGGWLQTDLGYLSPTFTLRAAMRGSPPGPTRTLLNHVVWLLGRGIAADTLHMEGLLDTRYVVLLGYPPSGPNHSILGREFNGTRAQQSLFEQLGCLELLYEGPAQAYQIITYDRWEQEITAWGRVPIRSVYEVAVPARLYANPYWTPRIFAPSATMVVVGGLNALSALSRSDSVVLPNWNVVVANDVYQHGGSEELERALASATCIAFVGAAAHDMELMVGGAILLDAGKVAQADWSVDAERQLRGELVYGSGPVRSANSTSSLRFGVSVPEAEQYEIWVRSATEGLGSISCELNGTYLSGVITTGQAWEPCAWRLIGSAQLQQGRHQLLVVATGRTTLDVVAVVPAARRADAVHAVADVIKRKGVALGDCVGRGSVQEALLSAEGIPLWNGGADVSIDVGTLDQGLATDVDGHSVVPISITRSGSGPLLTRQFTMPEDWRMYDLLTVDVKGVGSEEIVNIYLGFGSDDGQEGGWVRYSVIDTSSEWQHYCIPLTDYAEARGVPEWGKVTSIRLEVAKRKASRTLMLGDLAVESFPTTMPDVPLGSAVNVEFTQVSACKYAVSIAANAPYTLVMSNAFHPLWRAFVNGKEYKPDPSYYCITSFRIDQTGEQEVVIEFIGQRFQLVAFWVSGATCVGCLMWPALRWGRRRTSGGGQEW